MCVLCLTNPPSSHVPCFLGALRIKSYRSTKRDVLTEWIRVFENETYPQKDEAAGIVYSSEEFKALVAAIYSESNLSGVRVYFASYKIGNLHDVHIPVRQENILTLIYAPTRLVDGKHKDTGRYYIVSGQSTGPHPLIIELGLGSSDIYHFPWVEHYELKAKELEKPGPSNPVQETRSTWFGGDSFRDWVKEIDCWINNGRKVSGIYIAFAAYCIEEPVPTPYKYQLTLIIRILPDNRLVPADLPQDTFFYNFSMRKATSMDNRGIFSPLSDFDTSVPCPPASCP